MKALDINISVSHFVHCIPCISMYFICSHQIPKKNSLVVGKPNRHELLVEQLANRKSGHWKPRELVDSQRRYGASSVKASSNEHRNVELVAFSMFLLPLTLQGYKDNGYTVVIPLYPRCDPNCTWLILAKNNNCIPTPQTGEWRLVVIKVRTWLLTVGINNI